MKNLLKAGMVIATMGLAGCQTDSMVDRISELNPLGEDKPEAWQLKPVIEQAADEDWAQEPVADDNGNGNGIDSVALHEESALGVADLPKLETYMTGVLKRLQAHWPYSQHDVTVRVFPDLDISAQTLSKDTILISLGLLRNLQSEDQLAYILAHEYAHTVYDHHKKLKIKDLRKKLLTATKVGFQVAMIIKAKDDGEQITYHDILRQALIVNGSEFLTGKLLEPAWGREQEQAADLLATDLMIRAGYNVQGGLSALKIFEAKEERERKAEKARLTEQEELLNAKADETFNGNGDSTEFVGELFDTIKTDIAYKAADITSDHPDARERQTVFRTYIRTHYRRRARTKLKTDAFEQALNAPGTKERLAGYIATVDSYHAVETGDLDTAWNRAVFAMKGRLTNDALVNLTVFKVYQAKNDVDGGLPYLEKSLPRPAPRYAPSLIWPDFSWTATNRKTP